MGATDSYLTPQERVTPDFETNLDGEAWTEPTETNFGQVKFDVYTPHDDLERSAVADPPEEEVVEFLSCTRVRIHGNWDHVEIDVHGYPGGHIDTEILSPELSGTTIVDLETAAGGFDTDEWVIDAVSLGRDSDDQFFSVYREHPNKQACDEQIAPDTETSTPTETPTEPTEPLGIDEAIWVAGGLLYVSVLTVLVVLRRRSK